MSIVKYKHDLQDSLKGKSTVRPQCSGRCQEAHYGYRSEIRGKLLKEADC